eukprot:11216835-Ditylum_brightwellii.AAC.1
MQHHVKTTAGVSTAHYCKKYGKGQSKTSSLANWLFQISTLLGALHKLMLGINMFSVCNRYVEQRVTEAFVDDTDCTYVDQEDQAHKTLSRICDQLKSIAQTWENLIFGSGG